MKFKTPNRESKIEKAICKVAEECGWKVYKFVSPNNRGVPDRLAIKNGQTIYFEVKRPGEKLRPLQEKVHADFAEQGVTVHTLDNVADAKELFSLVGEFVMIVDEFKDLPDV